ncbi:hypothetical protein BRADI_2g36735v3 [Brachypodium distachyon]|uniref:Uncharacterized protein n=1 Tax=Brachypodium distachyon TaxID=15368 RepID=A0A0Q3MTG8_BRADI|nr:hypothetical protein BRADI_2g36735v3 [Brachypodium distachyon]
MKREASFLFLRGPLQEHRSTPSPSLPYSTPPTIHDPSRLIWDRGTGVYILAYEHVCFNFYVVTDTASECCWGLGISIPF